MDDREEKPKTPLEGEVVDAEDDPMLDIVADSEDALPELDQTLPLALDDESASDTVSDSREISISDPLERYMAEIRRFPTLSREEEHALAVRYFQQKDPQAAYKLVVANLRLVVLIAREYQKNLKNILDLIQEGNIGLMEAVKQYDPFRGVRFPSYAVYWVRAYMLRYLINNIRLVKVGTTQAQRKLFFNLKKEKEKLQAEGFSPEAKLLAKRLNVKESEVLEMEQRLALPDVSVDAPLSQHEGGLDWHSVLADGGEDVEGRVAKSEFQSAVRSIVDELKLELDPKEKAILERRLFTEEPQTLQEIADEFSLSRERIRQLETRVKTRLAVRLRERLGLDVSGEVVENDGES